MQRIPTLVKNISIFIRLFSMLKKLWVSGVLICLLQQVSAQKKQDVYYYKNNGQIVSDKDSADFIRIIQEPDSGETNFNLIEIYPDGKKKAMGKVSSVLFSMPVYEGQYLSYHKNGKKKVPFSMSGTI